MVAGVILAGRLAPAREHHGDDPRVGRAGDRVAAGEFRGGEQDPLDDRQDAARRHGEDRADPVPHRDPRRGGPAAGKAAGVRWGKTEF